jgi:hypothetical protein
VIFVADGEMWDSSIDVVCPSCCESQPAVFDPLSDVDRKSVALELLLMAYRLKQTADPEEESCDYDLQNACLRLSGELRDLSNRVLPPTQE